jgi:plasmid stability protein
MAGLEKRAAENQRAVEDEAHAILVRSLASDGGHRNLGASVRARFSAIGVGDLEFLARGPGREIPSLE